MPTMTETKALEFAYPAEEGAEPVLALRGVDTAIEKGSFVVVLGHNGSGKSTFAKCLNAILLPCGGKVYVEGMDTQDEALPAGDSPAGWAWCSRTRTTRSLPTWWRRMWPLRRKIWACRAEEIRRRVDDALTAVGMYRLPRACAAVCSPADRSSAWPSPACTRHGAGVHRPGRGRPPCWTRSGRREVHRRPFDRLNREEGITVVLITHHMDEADAGRPRRSSMDDGKIVAGRDAGRRSLPRWSRCGAWDSRVPDTVELLDALRGRTDWICRWTRSASGRNVRRHCHRIQA